MSLPSKRSGLKIQDELFEDHVRSVEPPNSLHFKDAEGKGPVRRKRRGVCEEGSGISWSPTTQPL